MNLKQLKERIQELGLKKVERLNPIPIPPIKLYFGYRKGLTFTIPKDYDVYFEPIRNDHGDMINYNYFILVKLEDGDYHIFYPSVLYRKVAICDCNGPTGEFDSVKGTVVDYVQKFNRLDEAVNALIGKKIQITEVRYVHTIRNRMVALPTFDFVE